MDFDYTLAFARAALKAGVKRFVLNSSVGADPAAKNFYLRVKGETEEAVAKLGFASLDILQPSLLSVRALSCGHSSSSPWGSCPW